MKMEWLAKLHGISQAIAGIDSQHSSSHSPTLWEASLHLQTQSDSFSTDKSTYLLYTGFDETRLASHKIFKLILSVLFLKFIVKERLDTFKQFSATHIALNVMNTFHNFSVSANHTSLQWGEDSTTAILETIKSLSLRMF